MNGQITAHILLSMKDTTTDQGNGKKNRFGRGKIYGVDISRTLRTVAAITILQRMISLDTP